MALMSGTQLDQVFIYISPLYRTTPTKVHGSHEWHTVRSGLDFWLSSVACHCPNAPVIIVGTQLDQVFIYISPLYRTTPTKVHGSHEWHTVRSGLDFWLSSVACHCPNAPVIIVGTQLDQVFIYISPLYRTTPTKVHGSHEWHTVRSGIYIYQSSL